MSTPRKDMRPTLAESVRRMARLSFAKSGGRGGQNVNKVSSKVLARVEIGSLAALSDEEKTRVRAKLATRINDRDELVVLADDARTQGQNRDSALERIVSLVEQASRAPRKRVKTRPTRSSREKRIETKRRTSTRKRDRRTPDSE